MSLMKYNQKRQFNQTPEPEGKEKSSKGKLRFVVQKHDASSLHYDFRLEMGGVLKSWAVPKGPSLNPSDRRLAMLVEDHPLDYRNFEGVIPEGEYGGGIVMVWDEGTIEPFGDASLTRSAFEKQLLQNLEEGKVKFSLSGSKLKGAFTLYHMKARGENTWILMKLKDEFVSTEDVTEQDGSVRSGKTIAEIGLQYGAVPHHPEDTKKTKAKAPAKVPARPTVPEQVTAPAKRSGARKTAARKLDIKALLGGSFAAARKAPMPGPLKPMLATLVSEPFDDRDWIFEIKWDGYRSVAYCDGSDVQLISRNLKPFTDRYKPVADALSSLNLQAVFDGEVVAVDEKGLANFQLLQNWQNSPSRLQFFIFDIMWLNGYDLTALPLIERKRILQELLGSDNETIRYSDHVEKGGNKFFKVALKQGLEGIMAKNRNSIYTVAARSDEWVKIKVNLRQEVVIAGYTEPRKSRKFFGSLLLGVYDGKDLVYVGHTGSGFNKKSLEEIYNKLQKLVISESPFAKKPRANMPATWVKPELVCEIKFTEWTKDNIARHPIFMGLRVDKKAKDVVLEKAVQLAKGTKTAAKKEAVSGSKAAAKKSAPVKAPEKTPSFTKKGGKVEIDLSAGEEQLIVVNRHELKLTNLQKLYWKKEGFSKGDMIRYYGEIAPFILPYLKDRPQSLNRHPNGIDAPNFFQKDMKGKLPEWMPTHEDFSESTDTTVSYLVCRDEATLLYMANLGCIEINPWHSRSQSWQQPDWCLLDLDPDKSNTYEQVMDVARLIKEILDSIGAPSCVKTSGSTGIHIYIPLGAKYSFDASKELAEGVVGLVNRQMPDLTSVERNPAKRKGKIYLDFLQNRETQTAAAPYSLRPKPGVPVSTPLDWSELKKGLTSATWNARNILDRLKTEGDLFKPVLGKGIALEKVLRNLASLK